ncbi:60S ribosomal protein L6 [Sitodiplosis mosellana]|uniref:60S ribosomal protein L6 n=1 Tax=Sitodiplosis mosellana TaxID=263140 RepID=UPI002444AD3E|nr:60S ribosomal protein L6 [Sitodiplosis mosellana]
MSANKVAKKDDKKAKKPVKKLNYDLGGGLLKYSRSQQYKRKALWRFAGKKRPVVKVPKKPITAVKKVNGAKNGGERVVSLLKPKSNYPTKPRVASRPGRQLFKNHKRNTRKSLKPGRVVILLAGRQKGKRVVLLKVLKSGLLLVTGPYSLNQCPLRRISQRYVIATSTSIDISKVKVPAHINDAYFKRADKKEKNRGEGDVFAVKKERYVPSEQKKADQAAVDKAVRTALSTHKDKKILFKYIRSYFALSSGQCPHRLRF